MWRAGDDNRTKVGAQHAFSHFTARLSAGWVLLIYLTLVLLPVELSWSVFVLPTASLILLAVVAFAWPLWGLHRLLDEEKKRQQAENNRRLKAGVQRLHSRVDAGDLERMDDLHKAIASLVQTQEVLDRVPTWPWQPGTLRGLVTAVLLPIVLWTMQQLLERFLPF